MTLDASESTTPSVPGHADRLAGKQDEVDDLSALKALLTDSSVVSSEGPETADLLPAEVPANNSAAAEPLPDELPPTLSLGAPTAAPQTGFQDSDDAGSSEPAEEPVPSALVSERDAGASATAPLDKNADTLALEAALPDGHAVDREAMLERADRDDPVVVPATEGAGGVAHAVTQDDVGAVILLPDLSGKPPSEEAAGFDDPLLQHLAGLVTTASDDTVEMLDRDIPGLQDSLMPGLAESSEPSGALRADAHAQEPSITTSLGAAGLRALPDLPGDEAHSEPGEPSSGHAQRAEAATEVIFGDALLEHISGVASISSDSIPYDPDAVPASKSEPVFDGSLPDTGAGPEAPASADMVFEAATDNPAAALAFATDADTEEALREGLFGFGGASGGTGEPQVWQGGLSAAIAALGQGYSARLIIVDIDGVPYPGGAIHELAAVCEVGTVVIAVGSDDSARPGREALLAGVSDYLAKPLTADAVRGAVDRVVRDGPAGRPGGSVVGFVGCGGSGATTLATATALHAAARGCYVSMLDLSRSAAAAALALGVEPAAGLDQLLETPDQLASNPETLEGVCVRRSHRIEVYAYRWSPIQPAVPSTAALDLLLAALRHRSRLVLIDGFDNAEMRFRLQDEIDARVLVAEPTANQIPHLARFRDVLSADRPLILVQNHTRAFGRNGVHALREAGIHEDVTVPFTPFLSETADWGWPSGKLPRSLRTPVNALTDRLLGMATGASAMMPIPTSREA